jgi:hypothetical protein
VDPVLNEVPPNSGTAMPAHEAQEAQEARSPSPLKLALRKARVEEAERSEVIAELRGAETARLEMLEEELRPALADIPKDVEMFDTALMPGDRPRLFIDMIGFVEMARDRRTYRFVQSTRYGRVLIAESERMDPIVSAVIDYVARRLIEREKALAGDMTLERAARAYTEERILALKHTPDPRAPAPEVPRAGLFSRSFAFIIEVLGSTLLFALLAIGTWKAVQVLLAWLAAPR